MRTISQILSQLEAKLQSLQHERVAKKVVVGFDVFVGDHARILSATLENFNISTTRIALDHGIFDSQLIMFVDRISAEHPENILQRFLQNVIRPSGRKDFIFFFDLCDPSKKSALEIDDILDLISDFSPYGKVTLALNENEALAIWSSLTGHDPTSVEEAGRFIHYTMKIDNVLIHRVDRSYVFTKTEMIELPGRFVAKPKIQTGGGDNLNAGFILGQLAGFGICESMVLGMVASGSFVQEGKTSDLNGLLKYIRTWKEELQPHCEELRNCEKRTGLLSFPVYY